jgi:hypothetical protein
MNHVTRASGRRVRRASRPSEPLAAGRRQNSQPGTAALQGCRGSDAGHLREQAQALRKPWPAGPGFYPSEKDVILFTTEHGDRKCDQ